MQYERLRQAAANGRRGGIKSGDARGTHLTAEELKTENGVHVRNMTNSAHPVCLFLLAIIGVTRLFVAGFLPKL